MPLLHDAIVAVLMNSSAGWDMEHDQGMWCALAGVVAIHPPKRPLGVADACRSPYSPHCPGPTAGSKAEQQDRNL